jgi:tRNA modification GTPase
MSVAELISLELREAIGALSLLVGEVATEELLGRIFARFCIGK